jgi:hypothetical protein
MMWSCTDRDLLETPRLSAYISLMTFRLKFSVVGLLLASLPRSAAAATWQQETTEWSKNSNPVVGNWGFDRPAYRDERLRRNHQCNSGHHHKGWGDDAYSDGNIFVAWAPAKPAERSPRRAGH